MEGSVLSQCALKLFEKRQRIVRVNQRFPLVLLDLFRGYIAEFKVSSIDKAVPALSIDYPDSNRTTVGHYAKAMFALNQGLLNPPALGDVFHMNYRAKWAPVAGP